MIEYVAGFLTTCAVIWFLNEIQDIGERQKRIIKELEDRTSVGH